MSQGVFLSIVPFPCIPTNSNASLLLPTFLTYEQQNLPLDVKRAWDYQMRKRVSAVIKNQNIPSAYRENLMPIRDG